jgi:hypothetical protein
MSFSLKIRRKNRSTFTLLGVPEVPPKGGTMEVLDDGRRMTVRVISRPLKGQPVEAEEV